MCRPAETCDTENHVGVAVEEGHMQGHTLATVSFIGAQRAYRNGLKGWVNYYVVLTHSFIRLRWAM